MGLQTETVWQELFDQSDEGILIVDSDFRIQYRNAAAQRFGPADDDPLLAENCRRALRRNSPATWETQSGPFLSFRALPSSTGGLHVWIRDISEQKAHEMALRSSEEWRLLALDAARMGAWSRTLDDDRIHLSARCREIFGLEPDTHFDLSDLFQAMHPEDRERIARLLDHAIRDHSDYDGEFRVRWPDGSEHWIVSRGHASYDADGRATRIQGVLLEITERKRTEEALRRSTSAFRTLVDASPLAIFTVDTAGRIQTWSASAETIFGWREAEVQGQHAPCVPPECVPEHIEVLARVIGGEVIAGMERTAQAKSGAPVVVSFSAAPLRQASGFTYGAVFVLRDVTEARAIERQLQHSQKLESLGVLAGGVAHDFNNLLTGILGNASLVMDTLAEEDSNRALVDEIVRASERAADLTSQLLAYAGKGRFVNRSVDLSEHVRETGTLIQSSMARQVHMIWELPPGLPLIDCDPTQVQQIVMNLLINAAESIPDGAPGTVLVLTRFLKVDQHSLGEFFNGDAAAPGPYVVLEVHDTGCGMDEATRARIFDPFFSTKFTGRGLGLSAVLGIVRGHRGALRVISTPGQGTSFTVLFPARDVPIEQAGRPQVLRSILIPGSSVPERDAAMLMAGFRAIPNDVAAMPDAIVLPLESEEQLARWQRVHPSVPVLAAVDCSEVEAIRRFPGCRVAGFIPASYTSEQLIGKLRALSLTPQNKKGPDESGPV